jgi:hypothetical protein
VFGVDVNRVYVRGKAGEIYDMDFSDRACELCLITDLDVLVG